MLEAPVVHGPSDNPSGLVIWLHGLGASGNDFDPVIPILGRPDLRFVLPHAPVRPVTLNGGFPMRAWYDIRHLEPGPDREPESDVRDTAKLLEGLIRQQQEATGVPWDRVVVVGFSQGGAMAYHLGLRSQERLAGIAALSTYMVIEDTLAAELSSAATSPSPLPVFVAHGSHDPTVPKSRGAAAHKQLEALGLKPEWHEYPMGHEVCMDELEELRGWLNEVLPPSA